jgi:hypothetical protein
MGRVARHATPLITRQATETVVPLVICQTAGQAIPHVAARVFSRIADRDPGVEWRTSDNSEVRGQKPEGRIPQSPAAHLARFIMTNSAGQRVPSSRSAVSVLAGRAIASDEVRT